MLAMPLAAAGVGFGTTFIMLVSLWALMCYTALLLVEVYQHESADTGLGTLAKHYLGRSGQWLAGASMLFFNVCVNGGLYQRRGRTPRLQPKPMAIP